MSVVRDIPCSDPFWTAFWKYLEEYWRPAIRQDPSRYNYWRSSAQVRMGKFKLDRSEGQEVIHE